MTLLLPWPFAFLFLLLPPSPSSAQQVLQAPCELSPHTPDPTRTVLLVRGVADDFVDVHITVPDSRAAGDIRLTHQSSDAAVLDPASGVEAAPLAFDDAGRAANVSLAFTFDKLPGRVDYGLDVWAARGGTPDRLCSVEVHFVVAGTAVYSGVWGDAVEVWSGRKGADARTMPYTDLLEDNGRVTLLVFSQFLDGTDSTRSLVGHPPLADVRVQIYEYARQIEFDPVTCDGHGLVSAGKVGFEHGCGLALAEEQDPRTAENTVYLGMHFNPFRGGILGITFDWPSFTQGHPDFEVALHSFDLEIRISGVPPPVITAVRPAGDVPNAGGKDMEVTAYNTRGVSNWTWTVDTIAQPFQFLNVTPHAAEEYFETMFFRTSRGTGTNLKWKLRGTLWDSQQVEAIDLTNPRYMVTYYVLELLSILPKQSHSAGGLPAVLRGFFDGFNRTTDHVVFSNKLIPRSNIVYSSSTRIEFTVPARVDIGPSYTYDVRVSLGSYLSNPVQFEYLVETIKVSILVMGSSYDEVSKRYLVGRCNPAQYQVIVAPGIVIAHYLWKIIDETTGDDLLASNDMAHLRTKASLSLDGNALRPGSYTFYVEVTTDGGSQGAASVAISKTVVDQIGVTLYTPNRRARRVPNAPLRVNSYIELPGQCYNGSVRMTFEWKYDGNTSVFSYENNTLAIENEATPLKLGREYLIPQELLRPGETPIKLRAYMTDHPEVFGTDVTTIAIDEGPLYAVIDDGLALRTVSVLNFVIVQGKQSYDSDTDTADGLAFEWGCESRAERDDATPVLCPNDAIPGAGVQAFTVRSHTLTAAYQSGIRFLYYYLRVSKESRVSEWTKTVLELVDSEVPEEVSAILENNRGERVDTTRLKFYEDTIVKISGSEELTWAYEVTTPAWSSRPFFETPGNLLAYSGFWVPTRIAREPLGIARGALEPGGVYRIAVKYFDMSKALEGRVEIELTVEEIPRLIFPDLPIVSGTPDTTFTATALTSFDSERLAFYFFLVGADGSEFCVGGCSGTQTQSFRIVRDGIYKVICRLYDAQGEWMLGEKENLKSLTVTNPNVRSSFGARRFDEGVGVTRDFGFNVTNEAAAVNETVVMMDEFFTSGDHASYEENSFQLAKSLQRGPSVSDEQVNMVGTILGNLQAMIGRAVPNPLAGKNYVKIVAEFAKLDASYFVDQSMVYNLLYITKTVFDRTPRTERLQIIDEVRRVFNRTRSHSINLGAAGTTRGRVIADWGTVNNLLLDTYELQATLIMAAATRSELCGYKGSFSTAVEDGRPKEKGIEFDHSVVSAYIPCTSEQEAVLRAEHSEFSWHCRGIFDHGYARRYITLMETPDFVFDSGVQGRNESDTLRLIYSKIMKEDANGSLVHIEYLASSCYEMEVEMSRVENASEGLSPVAYYMEPHKVWEQRATEFETYNSRFEDIERISNDGAKSLRIRTGHLGLFGALVGRGGNAPLQAGTQEPRGVTASSPALIGLLGGMFALLAIIVGAVWIASMARSTNRQGFFPQSGVTPGPNPILANYIDRDVFGRSVVQPEVFQGDNV